ncbi:Fic family protein [Alkalicoccus urumqiensis]|uniref:Fic family protein n=1 Tax=Alkalicoccus urumqiensis TaxID=1548213 RepID=A0A2P6MIN2_ALKUR|nr:Fic family protein [Alkalicoccus urumqiensis]PRO66093.1 Fic family protein [Alkalicoccus urumqiensis]
MKTPYDLPLLPIAFSAEEELGFYKKAADTAVKLERLRQKMHYSLVRESFIQLLTLKESVQSTRIEGTQVTFHEMLEDEIDHQEDWERIEVRNYRRALQAGMEAVQAGYPLSERLIRQMHAILMEGARGSTGAEGEYRRIQNFIGPTKHQKDASYVPPEPQRMGEYMSNLEQYINGHPYKKESDDPLHPLIKSALIHAQFESIHPFLDGNGRLGRILIVLYLMRTDVIASPAFFLSEELEKERFRYYALLNGVRAIGKSSPDWHSWIHFFLDAASRMADAQSGKLDRAEQLYQDGLTQLHTPSAKQVWKVMMMYPVSTIKQAAETAGMPLPTVRRAFQELVQQQLVFSDDRKRNKKFFQYDLIRIIGD